MVAREAGAHYGGVLYVDSLSAADGPVPTYLDLLRVTTQTIIADCACAMQADFWQRQHKAHDNSP